MRGPLFLAWKHVIWHRGRSAILIACLALTLALPIGSRLLTSRFERRLMDRAQATPLVVGAAGSRFDLAMNTLHFRGRPLRETVFREVEAIRETAYARAIPLFVRFRAAGVPVVGTSISDYFAFRRLRLTTGTVPQRLGDCVLGADAARRLQLTTGSALLTEPEIGFDFDSSFPLRMRVTGVLASTGTSDDLAVFVELPTVWLIAGIGHGHTAAPAAGNKNLDDASANTPKHDASLIEFTEITDENVGSFHFHGNRADFPLTGILAIPTDERSATLLEGRYLRPESAMQALRPVEIVHELLDFVVQLQRLFDVLFAGLGLVTILLLCLVAALSIRLREREFRTMSQLGGSRLLVAQLIAFEQFILLAIALLLAGLLLLLASGVDDAVFSFVSS